MLARQLIIAVLMLLSLSAQASAAWLSCGRAGPAAAECCDPHRQSPGCPAPGSAGLSCDQACATDIAAVVSAALEREQQTATLDPIDASAALVAPFYELLAAADPPESVGQTVEPAATPYPIHPTYLVTARLRL
jgi:hypothetical protein